MNDLENIKMIIERFEKIPKSSSGFFELWDKEPEKAEILANEIARFLIDLEAFIKVVFNQDSKYLSQFNSIKFFPNENLKRLNKDNLKTLKEDTWGKAIRRLGLLLMRIEAELQLTKKPTLNPISTKDSSKYDLVELVRKYSLSAIILTGVFFLGQWIERNSIHQETQKIQSKYDSLKAVNLSLVQRLDSLMRYSGQKSGNQPANKGD